MKKLGVVITDGVGFRNFIMSDFMAEAEKSFEVVILSCLPATVYSDHVTHSKIIELNVFEEKFKTWFFRKAKEVAHLRLYKNNNFGINDNYQANKSKMRNPRGYATRFIFRLTSVLHSEKWILRYNALQQFTFRKHPVTAEYIEILKKENVDMLFFTHQRPPFIAPLAYAAKKTSTKTASFIFSWDNLASKGRMAADFDYFLVWSVLMKKELEFFYKTVNSENITIVGTPQFEPYVLDRYKMNVEEFYKRFELDSSLKTICFSCGDISTSKNDELYIETIIKAINVGALQKVNFIVRTSPAEDPIRFKDLAAKYPTIVWNYPKWVLSRENHQESWSQRIPSIEDVKDLRALLEYCSLNVNMLSTMSLDFMQFDKPVVNPVFGTATNGLYNDQRFLKYAHLVNVVESNATKIAINDQELMEVINLYLNNPELDKVNRTKLLDLQVSRPLIGTGRRITEALLKWV